MPRRKPRAVVESEALEPVDVEGNAAAAASLAGSETDAPVLEPLRSGGAAEAADAPTALPDSLLQAASTELLDAAPELVPPTEAEIEAAEAGGIAAWHNTKKITALWSNSSNRNSYISVPGLGWKKLCNANDSCVVSMTMMAAHAEQTNANVNIRIEADGLVHEIYVW